jgi:hypothetical protein
LANFKIFLKTLTILKDQLISHLPVKSFIPVQNFKKSLKIELRAILRRISCQDLHAGFATCFTLAAVVKLEYLTMGFSESLLLVIADKLLVTCYALQQDAGPSDA